MSWAVTIGAGISVAGTAYGTYKANQAKEKAQNQLDDLNKTPLPQRTADPALLNYYQTNLNRANNPQGISNGEKAAYNQNVTNNVNTQMYNATNTSGGNLAKYLHLAFQPSTINSSNQLVNQDQSIKRQDYLGAMGRVGGAVNQLQNINDGNSQNAWTRRMMIEQSLGGAINSNNAYETNAVSSASNDIGGAFIKQGLKNHSQGDESTTTTTPKKQKIGKGGYF